MFRPPSYDEAVGGTEPAPFADMFGDPDDIFAEVGMMVGVLGLQDGRVVHRIIQKDVYVACHPYA